MLILIGCYVNLIGGAWAFILLRNVCIIRLSLHDMTLGTLVTTQCNALCTQYLRVLNTRGEYVVPSDLYY